MRVGGGAAGIFGFWLIKKSFFTKKTRGFSYLRSLIATTSEDGSP